MQTLNFDLLKSYKTKKQKNKNENRKTKNLTKPRLKGWEDM